MRQIIDALSFNYSNALSFLRVGFRLNHREGLGFLLYQITSLLPFMWVEVGLPCFFELIFARIP